MANAKIIVSAVFLIVASTAWPASAAWELLDKTDDITDVRRVFLVTLPVKPLSSDFGRNPPLLEVGCVDDQRQVNLATGDVELAVTSWIGTSQEVTYRLDDSPPVTIGWVVSDSKKRLYSLHPEQMLDQLKKARTMKVRFLDAKRNYVSVAFDVSGLTDALLKPLRDACKWD